MQQTWPRGETAFPFDVEGNAVLGPPRLAPARTPGGEHIVETALGPVAMEVHRRIDDLHELWTEFEQDALCLYAQTFAWSEAWVRLAGRSAIAAPVFVVGRNAAGAPYFIWPFEIVSIAGLKVLRWLSEGHANYNLGLHDAAFAAAVDGADLKRLLAAAAGASGAVAVTLSHQPLSWDGMPNPFAELPLQPSPNNGHAVRLDVDFATLYHNCFGARTRQSLARKKRRLADLPAMRMAWAETPAERARTLEAFFRQKAEWFAEQGIANEFAPEGVRAFYREVSELSANDAAPLLLGFVEAEDDVLATYCVVRSGDRLFLLLSSLTDGDAKRFSPGQLLLAHQIAGACEHRLAYYDFGAGLAPHKAAWSNEEIALFDTHMGFTWRGRLLAGLLRAKATTKRFIKSHHPAWTAAQWVRRALLGRSGPGQTAAGRPTRGRRASTP